MLSDSPYASSLRLPRMHLGGIWVRKGIASLIWVELVLLSCFGFMRDMLGFPASISYVLDAINMLLIGTILLCGAWDVRGRYLRWALGIVAVFLLIALARSLAVGESALLFLWGVRNTFRFYIFLFCCAVLLSVRDVSQLLTFFKVLFFVNVPLCVFEYRMGYTGDYLGGSFGITQGCNGYLNILLVSVLVIYVVEYLARRTSLLQLVLVVLLSCLVMALAELKVFLFELVLVVVLVLLLRGPSARAGVLMALIVTSIALGLVWMQLFSDFGIDFFTTDAILTYMGDEGYTGSGDLSRMGAVASITRMFFRQDPAALLFGFGLGNCSTSNFAALNSSFYIHFSDLHYSWFSDASIYLEMGAVGLALYEGFFLFVFVISRLRRYRNCELRIAMDCSGIMALIAPFLSVYNVSMNIESGYMVYAFLALPFIVDKYHDRSRSVRI